MSEQTENQKLEDPKVFLLGQSFNEDVGNVLGDRLLELFNTGCTEVGTWFDISSELKFCVYKRLDGKFIASLPNLEFKGSCALERSNDETGKIN